MKSLNLLSNESYDWVECYRNIIIVWMTQNVTCSGVETYFDSVALAVRWRWQIQGWTTCHEIIERFRFSTGTYTAMSKAVAQHMTDSVVFYGQFAWNYDLFEICVHYFPQDQSCSSPYPSTAVTSHPSCFHW